MRDEGQRAVSRSGCSAARCRWARTQGQAGRDIRAACLPRFHPQGASRDEPTEAIWPGQDPKEHTPELRRPQAARVIGTYPAISGFLDSFGYFPIARPLRIRPHSSVRGSAHGIVLRRRAHRHAQRTGGAADHRSRLVGLPAHIRRQRHPPSAAPTTSTPRSCDSPPADTGIPGGLGLRAGFVGPNPNGGWLSGWRDSSGF